jgi:hypothetical protein
MRKILTVLALISMAACSNLPVERTQAGEVNHPDAFHSYIN